MPRKSDESSSRAKLFTVIGEEDVEKRRYREMAISQREISSRLSRITDRAGPTDSVFIIFEPAGCYSDLLRQRISESWQVGRAMSPISTPTERLNICQFTRVASSRTSIAAESNKYRYREDPTPIREHGFRNSAVPISPLLLTGDRLG